MTRTPIRLLLAAEGAIAGIHMQALNRIENVEMVFRDELKGSSRRGRSPWRAVASKARIESSSVP